ncbi:MAG: methenyltetrahydromethanopterin cyclohydrolase [Planctomycetes bacterium]|nr:methenyltetrahydromethanopterin cyclohydrolase [Planctomycetota bacterium]
MPLRLNERTATLCKAALDQAAELKIAAHTLPCGTTLIDFGISVPGSQAAGIMLAKACLADLATVEVEPTATDRPTPVVSVSTDHPVAACMASQYAGWEIKGEKFFAMGSGPMRAAAGREPLFEDIGYRETPNVCIGVLESSKFPNDQVCREIATKCNIEPSGLTLLVAPTSSIAGTLQVVARSVETALHKLHELGFDLTRIERAKGFAPLPPVANDDFAAIGITNDAILYGGQVTLELHGDDQSLQKIGPQVPSSASKDYGRPFAEVLASYNNDFYQVDPLLFSAAMVTFINLDTGNQFTYGKPDQEILARSFATE